MQRPNDRALHLAHHAARIGLSALALALLTGGCGPSVRERVAETFAEMNREPIAWTLEHLRSIQQCFTSAGGTAAQASRLEVVPQAGIRSATGARYSPGGDTFAVIGTSLGIYSSTGLQRGSIDRSELDAGDRESLEIVYSADGSHLLIWAKDRADAFAGHPAVVVDTRSGTVVHRCSVKAPALGAVISAGGRLGLTGVAAKVIVDGATGNTLPVEIDEAGPSEWGVVDGAFSPDGSWLLVHGIRPESSKASLFAFDARTGRRTAARSIEEDGKSPTSLAISNDGQVWAYAAADGMAFTVTVTGPGGSPPLLERPVVGPTGQLGLAPDGRSFIARVWERVAPRPGNAAPKLAEVFHRFGWEAPSLARIDVERGGAEPLPTSESIRFSDRDETSVFIGEATSPAYVIDRDSFDLTRLGDRRTELPSCLMDGRADEDRVYVPTSSPGLPESTRDWQYPELIATSPSTGTESWRSTLPSSYAGVAFHDTRVVAIRGNGLGELSVEDLDRYRNGLPLSIPKHALFALLSAQYVYLLDARTGARRAFMRAEGVVGWDASHLLVLVEGDEASCVRLFSTVAWQYAGEAICTPQQPRPITLSDGIFSATLVKHPSKQQAAILGNDRSVFLFDGRALRELQASTGRFDRIAVPRGAFARKRDELFVSLADEIFRMDLGTGAARKIADVRHEELTVAGNDTRLLAFGRDALSIFDARSGERLARWFFFAGDEWAILGEDGAFAASPGGARHLAVRVGGEVQALEQYAEQLYRPDAVLARLAGDPATRQEVRRMGSPLPMQLEGAPDEGCSLDDASAR